MYGLCLHAVPRDDARSSRRRCKFWKQVRDVGRFELFKRFEKLDNFVKTSVDKYTVPQALHDIYFLIHLHNEITDSDCVG